MKPKDESLKARTVEIAQYERLNKSLLNPSLLSGLLTKSVIALFVMGVEVLCNERGLNRMALIRIFAGLRRCFRASRIVYRGYWRLFSSL